MTDVKDRPEASADAELILKLQDKLDSLKNQIHTWTAKAKGKPRKFLVSSLNCKGLFQCLQTLVCLRINLLIIPILVTRLRFSNIILDFSNCGSYFYVLPINNGCFSFFSFSF